MPEDSILQEAVEAIRQGQRGRARDIKDCKNFIGIAAPYLVSPPWKGYNRPVLNSTVFWLFRGELCRYIRIVAPIVVSCSTSSRSLAMLH